MSNSTSFDFSRVRLSVSTWALHSVLGQTFPDKPGDPDRPTVAPAGPGSLPLLDIPGRLAELGFGKMELCHFHLPSRDAAYLADLRAALDAANVELWSLLIDDGDISHPSTTTATRLGSPAGLTPPLN
jgi:hypothetical protein